MSQFGLQMQDETPSHPLRPGPGGPGRGSGRASALAVLVALGILVALFGGLWFGGTWLLDRIPRGSADYAGPGSGEALVKVEPGDSVSAIGNRLVDAGVVQSVKAFVRAVDNNSDASSLQPGTYRLMKEMRASDALTLMLDPASRVVNRVTIREGLRVGETLAALAKGSGIPLNEFTAALKKPQTYGLPEYAGGKAEGFLFPATYDVEPDTTATSLLAAMTASFVRTAENVGLEEGARRLGYTPHEVLIVASIAQAEGSRPEDFAKIARVIYNRVKARQALQLDTTVNYATGKKDVFTTPADRAIDSPYNTYKYPGLPAGPIDSPGAEAIEAALQPTPGDWMYFVAVNLKTGETKFAETYEEHLRYVEELRRWVAANP